MKNLIEGWLTTPISILLCLQTDYTRKLSTNSSFLFPFKYNIWNKIHISKQKQVLHELYCSCDNFSSIASEESSHKFHGRFYSFQYI